jgi:hypothetical protein
MNTTVANGETAVETAKARTVGGHPPAASETGQRSAGRPALRSGADAVCCAFEMGPMHDLLDKHGPSALEWSLLPHIAGGTACEGSSHARWTRLLGDGRMATLGATDTISDGRGAR